jgi:hypothetical protein
MEHQLPLAVVCRLLDAPRSTIYTRRRTGGESGRRGPMPAIGDQELIGLIRRVLTGSPFAGEGYRKVRARLHREHGVRVSSATDPRRRPTRTPPRQLSRNQIDVEAVQPSGRCARPKHSQVA